MKRRNLLIGMGSFAAAGGAAVGTGAFDTAEANRDVAVRVANENNAFLSIQPSNTANGQFATQEPGDNQIALDFSGSGNSGSGVGQDSVYNFDDVFRIANQGTQTVYVWTNLSGGSKFDDSNFYLYPNGARSTELNDGSNSVLTLSPGESAKIGVHVDTGGLSTGSDIITATIRADVDRPAQSGVTQPDGDLTTAVVSPNPSGNQFGSIQDAIDAVTGSTVLVKPGTYREQVTVDVPGLKLAGLGGTPTIQPSQDLNYGGRANVLQIEVDDVLVENIAVDGDNPTKNPTINAPLGVYLDGATGVTLRNMRIENTNAQDAGVTIGVWAPPNSAVTVEDSSLRNHQTGIFVRGQVTAENNVLRDVERGINTNNINGADDFGSHNYGDIVGNDIEATSIGIRLNNHYESTGTSGPSQSGAPVYSVRNNVVSGPSGETLTEGINVLSISDPADVDLEDNQVSNCVRGYDLTNLTTEKKIRIDGGSVTDCDNGLVAFSDNGAFSGAQYGRPEIPDNEVDKLVVGSGVSFSNNTNFDIRAYGSDVTMTYEGTSASTSAENGATIN